MWYVSLTWSSRKDAQTRREKGAAPVLEEVCLMAKPWAFLRLLLRATGLLPSASAAFRVWVLDTGVQYIVTTGTM